MNYIYFVFFILSNSLITLGQITLNPVVENSNCKDCKITSVDIQSSRTIVTLEIIESRGNLGGPWIRLASTIFLSDYYNSNVSLKIQSLGNYQFDTEYHTKKGGKYIFTLIFPRLSPGIEKININEIVPEGGGWEWMGIKINNPKSNPKSNNNPIVSNNNAATTIISIASFDQSLINCNEIKFLPGSMKPTFENMLAGVKYAIIVSSPKINGHVPAFNALFQYLQDMGFQVKYLNDNYEQSKHLCEEIWISIGFEYDLQKFSNIKLFFRSPCNDYLWEFNSNNIASAGLNDNPQSNFYSVLSDMYHYHKPPFNISNRIELPKRLTCWNETKLKQDYKDNGVDQIEGIYENTSSSNGDEAKYKVAVKEINGQYYLIYLSGAKNFENWQEGELKATLETTATTNFYKSRWIMSDKSENGDLYVSFEQGTMSLIDPVNPRSIYLKMYPTANDNISSSSNLPASGTGFAITSNGLIVTNNHVIDGAKTIKVRGVNGDFSQAYSAKLITTDKNNDLAIIKIEGNNFSSCGTIPYVVKSTGSNVGENIFVLGYPLRATMGDEIKLTNGIISSKTGFQGDVTSYQISAPIQPGSSGGPLFDSQGNLLGIINAKHIGAENVSYAVKISYLLNLIDLLDFPPTLQKVSSVSGKPLTQKVSIIKKFVYIIEIN